MAQITQAGTLNTTALTVPDLYVQEVAPALVLQGVPSNRLGLVGTASWGPVNTSVLVSGMGSYQRAFGPKQNTLTDLGRAVNYAALNAVSDFRCVRVTDGTDAAASLAVSGVVTFVARYTGSAGNNITLRVLPQNNNMGTLLVTHPNLGSYSYSGASWAAIAQAVSLDASAIISIPSATASSFTAATYQLVGGQDGTPNSSTYSTAAVGSDTSGARTGLYVLRNSGCAVASILGVVSQTLWTQLGAFGLSEGTYVVTCGPPGETITSATASLQGSGAASPWLKVMYGDWVYVNDDTFGLGGFCPSLFAAAVLASQDPAQSSLNKAMAGVVGSLNLGISATNQANTYSNAELSALVSAGIDVITNPLPAGSIWGCRIGHNSSTNAATSGDNYPRMTGYIAQSLDASAGEYVGRTVNDELLGDIKAALLGFLQGMLSQGLLAMQGTSFPYSVVCDSTNNPQSRTSLGYVQADVAVRYMGINEKFIVNLQGGTTTVVVASSAG